MTPAELRRAAEFLLFYGDSFRNNEMLDLAAKLEAQAEMRLFACETCHDTGEIEVMTNHLGPDDYVSTIACPDCGHVLIESK